jgi:ribosomal protein S30
LLYWIKGKVNGGKIKEKKNYNPDRHRNSFTYEIKFNKAIDLLKEIAPYLIIEAKRKRAELIINNYKKVTLRNGRYSIEQSQKKEKFYEEFMSIK